MDIVKEIVVPIVCALISALAVGGIGTAICARIIKGDPKATAIRLLLQRDLDELITDELDRGWTTADRHKMIRQMYQSYKDLQGNGDVEWLMERYDRLVLKNDDRRTAI